MSRTVELSARPAALLPLLAALIAGPGCSAITNPVADGIPVHRLPEEIFPPAREELQPLPLTMLRQPPPESYRLGPGDVLGVFVEGLLGEKTTVPPVHFSEGTAIPPAIGYPVPVQENGTLTIPFADPIPVAGLTLDQAREAVRIAVTVKKELFPPDKAPRILVTLMRRRTYHVVVVRQDAGGVTLGPGGELGAGKRGSGFPIDLPAYENDVLNALARTGGLPGLEANNEVIIQRSAPKGATENGVPAVGETIRIPLRVRPSEMPQLRPEDVILRDGDIVFIEARDTELFYTAGLLPIGEFVLPRDYDLDVVEAVARVRGPLLNGGFNQQNVFNNPLQGGLGLPSPSLLTVLRRDSYGRQLKIRIDINRAMRDPRERILVQPGDILVLQEKPGEAVARYLIGIFRLNFVFNIIRSDRANATGTINAP